MSDSLVFLAWRRPGIYGLADAPGGTVPRLTATLRLEMRERDGSGPPATGDAGFAIMGPGDVRGLQRRAIRRMVPPPGTLDAETSKCVHVDLAAPDLPWRYTSELANGRVLKPWIVLVVGTAFDRESGLGEIRLLPDNLISLHPDVLAAHPLAESPRWAHIQIELANNHDLGATGVNLQALIDAEGGVPLGRLLSPRPLKPNRDYIAAIVPAFQADGTPSWSGAGGPVVTPVYHHWRFRSGEGGDFRTLAARLHVGTPDPRNGRAPLVYDRLSPPVELEVRGALAPVGSVDDDISATAVPGDVEALISPQPDPRGRPIIAPPIFGSAWVGDAKATAWGGGTVGGLNNDPRHRGVAGLGAHVGIVEQETIVDAVREHAGSIDIAAQRLAQLSIGRRAATGLWNQHLPAAPEHRLLIYGPAMRRMPTASGAVLSRIAGGERPMPPALFSSCARRVLRRGTARGDLAAPGATDPVAVIGHANTCAPLPEVFVPGLPHIDLFARSNGLPSYGEVVESASRPDHPFDIGAIKAFIVDVIGVITDPSFPRNESVIEFLEHLQACVESLGRNFDFAWLIMMVLRCLDPAMHKDGAFLEEIGGFRCEDHAVEDPPPLDAEPVFEPPVRPCVPVDLGALEESLTTAIDPTGERPWIDEVVLDTLDGVDDVTPPEIDPGVDMPTWRLLRDHHPDWLLPGVGLLEQDGVYAFESNPTFVDAFLLGLNTQTLGELRWRNLPIATGATPLRMFWGRVDVTDPGEERRLDDIKGVGLWADDTALGDAGHLSTGATGQNLVLVIRSELFRRYPGTLVSAVPANTGPNGQPDFDPGNPPAQTAERAWPIFQGTITEDVTFFGFDLSTEDARSHWIVLEEPPAGYRFRSDLTAAPPDGANFARARLNDPTRVLISGAQLMVE